MVDGDLAKALNLNQAAGGTRSARGGGSIWNSGIRGGMPRANIEEFSKSLQ